MIESDCTKRCQSPVDKARFPVRLNGTARVAAAIISLLTLPSVPFCDSYSMHGSIKSPSYRSQNKALSNQRATFALTASGRFGDSCHQKGMSQRTPFSSTHLFYSPAESNEGVPDISATQADIDFMSVHDIDWVEMNPFNEIQFDEYEELYLQGKARDDPSATKSNPGCDTSYESVMTEWDESVPTLNHISLVGRVGNPPEARYFDTPIGSEGNSNRPNTVVSMSLALPRYYSAWEREEYGIEYGQEETEWYNLEIWGTLAEFAMKNVQKGSRVGVVGSIDMDYYRNKDTGLLSTAPKLLVQDLDILESKMEADARRNNGYGNNNNYGGGGNNNYNSNQNYGNNNNNNNNMYQNRPQGERGPSFFTDDDDDEDIYDPRSGGGSAGGFFDPT